MIVKVVKDIIECERIWKIFSQEKTLWDIWEVAYSFYDDSLYEAYFIVLVQDNTEKGVLPLWFDKKEEEYSYFGGHYPENTAFWFDEHYFPLIFEYIPDNTKLSDINHSAAEKIIRAFPQFKDKFKQGDWHYFIDMKKIKLRLDNYLDRFSNKHKKCFLNDIKKIEQLNLDIKWGTTENLDRFIEFNVERFGKESDFSNRIFVKSIKRLFSYFKEKNILHTLNIYIDGKLQGTEIAVLYKDVYYDINGGYNLDIPNLGKFIILSHIKNAIRLKAKMIDFLAGKGGWKELWKLDKVPYYVFEK